MRRIVVCWIVVLGLLLGVGWMQSSSADPKPKESSPFAGLAVHISLKAPLGSADLFLEHPDVSTIAGEHFVVGHAIGRTTKVKVWLPLAQVNLLEEFADTTEMEKVYRVRPAQTEKKAPQ